MEKCVQAGKFLDLLVMEHIIVIRYGYFSFAEEFCEREQLTIVITSATYKL